MAAPDHSALRRCSGDTDAFALAYWGIKPLLRHGEDFADLLSFDAVDELLSDRALRTPFLRVVRDAKVVDAARFTGGGGRGAEVTDQVRDELIADELALGSTLVLQGLHRAWSPLRDFCLSLGGELGCAVQANAYLTPPEHSGFATHYDTHDVFVLQVAGSKRWRVHEPVCRDPLERQPWGGRAAEVAATAAGEPAIQATLRPGDVLYLPRGWLHAASAQGDMSLHLTLGLHRPTRYTIVEALLASAVDEEQLRSGLPVGTDLTDPEQLAPHLAATIEWVRKWTEGVSSTEMAARLRTSQWAASRPGPARPIAQAAAAANLTADSLVRLRAGLRFALTGHDQEITITLPERTVTLPLSCGPALRFVLTGEPVRVGDLPGLDEDQDRLVLVRRLLRESVVVPG